MKNSDAQETLLGGSNEFPKSWLIPQEIKDLVPVDFAMANLRDSRLKNEIDRNLSNQVINEVEKSSKFGAVKRFKQKNRLMNRTSEATDKAERKTKKSNRIKITPVRKYFRSRTRSSKESNTTTNLPEASSTVASKENPESSDSLSKIRVKSISSKSAHSFASIQRAINSLPEELVKIVRDDSDCNDDPEKKISDVRGPPCALSRRWTGSSGEMWLSPRNIINRNWKVPIN